MFPHPNYTWGVDNGCPKKAASPTKKADPPTRARPNKKVYSSVRKTTPFWAAIKLCHRELVNPGMIPSEDKTNAVEKGRD